METFDPPARPDLTAPQQRMADLFEARVVLRARSPLGAVFLYSGTDDETERRLVDADGEVVKKAVFLLT